MIKINETFKVKSMFTCDYIYEFQDGFEHDPIWRKTGTGCFIMRLLQDMFNFNITYLEDDHILPMGEQQRNLIPRFNDAVDFYILPMELRKEDLEIIYPVQCVFIWSYGINLHTYMSSLDVVLSSRLDIFLYPRQLKRVILVELTAPWETNIPKDPTFKVNKYYKLTNEMTRNGFGFILRQRYNGYLRRFYSEPFTNSVWICIYIMILIGALEFYLLSVWDVMRFGGECSFVLELLLAFSAYCQHILPLQAVSYSRRIAYLSFIMCAYIVHTFYASNLLRQLVMETDVAMDLEALVKSDYDFAIYKDMNLIIDKKKYESELDKNLSTVWNKLQTVKIMSLSSALTALMEARTAVMTDYMELYPILMRHFEIDAICHLMEIDLYSNVKNYLLTSKSFQYKEQFKVGTLRIQEAGLLRRRLAMDKYSQLQCKPTVNHYNTQWEHTAALLPILLVVYTFALLLMVIERIHYQRNRVWPYIE